MNDTISRKAAIDVIEILYEAAEKWGREATDEVIKVRAESCLAGLIEMKLRIEKLPSAQPERPKGEWIYGENDGQDGWYCSACGFFVPWDYEYYGLNNIDFIADYHTCPKCDAKMLRYTGMRGEEG